MHTKSTPIPKGEETKSGKRRGVGRGKCPNLLMTSGAGCLRLTPAILATSEDQFQASPETQFSRPPLPKITRAKWSRGMAQIVEACFVSMKP
jgi:hypothetical protein